MNQFQRRLILALSRILCLALHGTYRYRVINPQARAQAEALYAHRAFAIACWHQNCFAGILSHAKQNIALLISRSFDGAVISAVAKSLGHDPVRGSSRKGGREALEELIIRMPRGQLAAFTVDGPKGPIHQVKRGVLELSAKTGAPVLPMLAIADRFWTFHKSWDKFRVPKPFARVSVLYGQPFVVSDIEHKLESYQTRLKLELEELEARAIAEGLVPQLHRAQRASLISSDLSP